MLGYPSRRSLRAGSAGSRPRRNGSPTGASTSPYRPAPDELGQLARAFEQMRLRLASLDRARGEFIANASHELRTPLFSLAGFLELARHGRDVDAETREEFLGHDAGAGARLTKLATDLLDLSRMDAGGSRWSTKRSTSASSASRSRPSSGPRAP